MTKKHIHGPNIFDPNCKLCREFGMPVSKKANRHLLDESNPAFEPECQKGTRGEIGRIQRALDKLRGAEQQGVRVKTIRELADLYNTVRVYALKYGLKMCDLHRLAKAVRKRGLK
jgi:hypothetical protein